MTDYNSAPPSYEAAPAGPSNGSNSSSGGASGHNNRGGRKRRGRRRGGQGSADQTSETPHSSRPDGRKEACSQSRPVAPDDNGPQPGKRPPHEGGNRHQGQSTRPNQQQPQRGNSPRGQPPQATRGKEQPQQRGGPQGSRGNQQRAQPNHQHKGNQTRSGAPKPPKVVGKPEISIAIDSRLKAEPADFKPEPFRHEVHRYDIVFYDTLAAAKADLAGIKEKAEKLDQLNIVIRAEGGLDDPDLNALAKVKVFAGAAWTLIHERRVADGWYSEPR